MFMHRIQSLIMTKQNFCHLWHPTLQTILLAAFPKSSEIRNICQLPTITHSQEVNCTDINLYNSTSANWMGRSNFGFGFTTTGGGTSSKGNLKFARDELDDEISA